MTIQRIHAIVLLWLFIASIGANVIVGMKNQTSLELDAFQIVYKGSNNSAAIF